jgi:hypothetical protein
VHVIGEVCSRRYTISIVEWARGGARNVEPWNVAMLYHMKVVHQMPHV